MGDMAPTTPKNVRARERRARILELRIAGASSEQIARALGISRSQVWRHLKVSLESINQEIEERTAELRSIQAARIEQHISELMPAAASGDLGAHRALLRWYERQAKLLALDLEREVVQQEPTVYVVDMRTPDQREAAEAGPVIEIEAGEVEEIPTPDEHEAKTHARIEGFPELGPHAALEDGS